MEKVFSREYSHKDFCLAHLFTDLKFEGGILGLAYVGSPRRNSVGGICTPGLFYHFKRILITDQILSCAFLMIFSNLIFSAYRIFQERLHSLLEQRLIVISKSLRSASNY